MMRLDAGSTTSLLTSKEDLTYEEKAVNLENSGAEAIFFCNGFPSLTVTALYYDINLINTRICIIDLGDRRFRTRNTSEQGRCPRRSETHLLKKRFELFKYYL